MSTTDSNYKIEHLKGAENYVMWSAQISDILSELGLWEYASGATPCPADAAGKEAWEKKDHKALVTIRLRVSAVMFTHVLSSKTSKEALDALANVLNTEGTITRVTLRRKLFRYTIDEGADIKEEIRKIKALWDDLTVMRPGTGASAAGTLTDNDLALIMLTALPASWDPFVSSVTSPDQLTLSGITGRMIEEETRRKEREGTEATLVSYNKPKKSVNKFRAGVFCHNCGKEGHIRPECRSKGKEKDKQGRNNRTHIAEQDSESEDPDEYVFAVTDPGLQAASNDHTWLGDTGSQSHIVRDRSLFVNYTEAPGQLHGVGSCSTLGRGDVRVYFVTPSGSVPVTLQNAIHAPDMKYNLISLGRLTTAGLSYEGKGNSLSIKHGAKVIGVGRKTGYLYRIGVKNSSSAVALTSRVARTWYEWHCALGHLNRSQLKELVSKNLVSGMDIDTKSDQDFECDACVQAKHTRRPFPKAALTKYHNVGDIIYSDIWGPARTTSLQGNTYMITFTDGATRWVWTDYLKSRDEALNAFKKVEAFIKTQFQRDIKALQVDNAREYTQGAFRAYLDSRGTMIRPTAPYTPQQNGVSERLNRTIIEHARAMLIAHQLPRFLWQEAANYASYVKNRSPTRALPGKTPYQALWNTKPDLQDLQEFGVPCWVLTLPKEKPSKLEPKSQRFIFTGIREGTTGWRYYNSATRQILTSRDVIFERTKPAIEPESSEIRLEGENASTVKTTPSSAPTSASPSYARILGSTSPIAPSTPTRISLRDIPRVDYRELHTGRSSVSRSTTQEPSQTPASPSSSDLSDPPPSDSNLCFNNIESYAAISEDNPQSFAEVKNRHDWTLWKVAMDKEHKQLLDLGTYSLEDLPPDRKAVGCRWVFTIKRDSQGNVVKYKARLVAQGFSQIPGQDFTATHSPVMRLESFRVLVAISARLQLTLHQIDVVGAYLNSPLTETIYMRQIPGYDDSSGRVCRLHKALYGLKQAGRAWNREIDRVLISDLKFSRSASDPCIYFRINGTDFTAIGIHVDDMVIVASEDSFNSLRQTLQAFFDITDLGVASLFVGIQITHDERGSITLHQSRYIDTILERFKMVDCNPAYTPLDPNITLTAATDEQQVLTDVPYQVLIGSLMYAAVGTRPDIAFAAQSLSQFNTKPTQTHWTAAKHVLRYLKHTRAYGITFRTDGNANVSGFSDADWGQNRQDRRSVSGYAFLLADGIISWSSKRQPTVALSTMEAEYLALAHACKEALWLRALITELGMPPPAPTDICTDNTAAISFAHDHQFHARSKHIDIRHHFVRDHITAGDIRTPHCSSEDNCADILTKSLARTKHENQLSLINLSAR